MTNNRNIENVNLNEALNQLKRDIFVNLNCVQIGIIQSFNAENQTAKVRFAIKQVDKIENDGIKILKEKPILLEVPCFILYGGNAFITMPISAGDNCIILFNDREIDNWFMNGDVQAPNTRRAHDLSDAIAIVGLKNLQNTISGYITDGLRIAFGSDTRIDIKDDAINSVASLLTHTGDISCTGNISAATFTADNGATGSFNVVTVVNGIVTGGS